MEAFLQQGEQCCIIQHQGKIGWQLMARKKMDGI